MEVESSVSFGVLSCREFALPLTIATSVTISHRVTVRSALHWLEDTNVDVFQNRPQFSAKFLEKITLKIDLKDMMVKVLYTLIFHRLLWSILNVCGFVVINSLFFLSFVTPVALRISKSLYSMPRRCAPFWQRLLIFLKLYRTRALPVNWINCIFALFYWHLIYFIFL